MGSSLVVQWLRLCASHCRGRGFDSRLGNLRNCVPRGIPQIKLSSKKEKELSHGVDCEDVKVASW